MIAPGLRAAVVRCRPKESGSWLPVSARGAFGDVVHRGLGDSFDLHDFRSRSLARENSNIATSHGEDVGEKFHERAVSGPVYWRCGQFDFQHVAVNADYLVS